MSNDGGSASLPSKEDPPRPEPSGIDIHGQTSLERANEEPKGFKKQSKSKIKGLLRIDETKDLLKDSQDSLLTKLKDNAGFNLSNTPHAESSAIGQIREHLPNSAHELVHIIRHPQQAAQEKASQSLAASKEPYLSRDDNEALLVAHGNLQQAESVTDSTLR